jgi:hypothetical protein
MVSAKEAIAENRTTMKTADPMQSFWLTARDIAFPLQLCGPTFTFVRDSNGTEDIDLFRIV